MGLNRQAGDDDSRQTNTALTDPATCQIKVPDQFEAAWPAWAEGMTVTAEGERAPVTALTGTVDQATLHGLLRRLYVLGLLLISVVWIEEKGYPSR